MKLSVIAAAFCALSTASAACEIPYYSTKDGKVTVQLTGSTDPLYILENRYGEHRICLADYSFGMALYVVTCDDINFFNMRVVDDAGSISYDDIILEKRCDD